MSCGNPTTEQDALMTPRSKFDKAKICVKCKERSGNIVIRHAVYCKTCFFPLISTRFRKTLGPTINPGRPAAKGASNARGGRLKGLLQASGSVVVGLSGGLGSTVLLNLVAKSYFYRSSVAGSTNSGEASDANAPRGTEHPRNKAREDNDVEDVWKGKPAVCYVEICSVVPGARDRTEDVRAVVQSYSNPTSNFEIEFVPLRLEDAFDEAWWKTVGGTNLSQAARELGVDISDESLPIHLGKTSSSSTPLQLLHTYLSSLPTATAIHSAIASLIRVLLIYTASSRNASHLLLGTTLTSLSVNMISGIAQGAGFTMVAAGLDEAWTGKNSGSPQHISIVRPLRDVGIKESAFWAWWSTLRIPGRDRYPSFVSPTPLTENPGAPAFMGRQNLKLSSIDSLTRDFIMGLEKDYPSTVSTIARTLAKVTTKEKGTDGGCMICQKPAQPNVQGWKARISIRSYHDDAFVKSKHPLPPHFTAPPTLENTTGGPKPVWPTALAPRLCYACHTTFTSRSSRGSASSSEIAVPLPVWVQANLPARSEQEDDVAAEGHVPAANTFEAGGEEVWRTQKVGQDAMMMKIGAYLLDDTAE